MADLKFDVDSSEVSRAVDELIRMGKASKDTAKAFEQGFRKVVSWQEKFQTEQGRINATLEKNYRAQTLSNKSAKESAAVFQQLEAQVSKAATSYSQLKASIDPVYAAQLRMKKGHDAVRAALKSGLITRAEAAKSLRAYRTEVKSLSQAQMAATKSSNRLGVVTQQAGYQIGDFLVQVQSGTNPFVAFGQQATQLVGILPLMTGAFGLSTTALIGLSAGLGIAIPLVTSVGAALMKSSGSAETLSQSLDKLEETNDRLRTFGEAFGENLVGNIEAVRESFGNLVADVYEAQLNQVQSKLASAFGRGLFSESFAASYTAIKPSELSSFNQEQLNEQAQQELAIQEQINNIIGQTITSKSQLNALFDEAYDTLLESDFISEDGLERLKEIAIQNGVVLGIEKDRADLAANMGEQLMAHVKSYQDYLDKQKKARDNLAGEIVARRNNLTLLEIERQYGRDSVTYRAELVQQEKERLQALYGQDEAAQSLVKEALALYVETLKVNAGMDASADSAKVFVDALKEAVSAMSSLSGLGDSLDKKLSVSVAKVQALKSGADAAIAGQVAGYEIDIRRRTDDAVAAAVAAGQSPSAAIAEGAKQMETLTQLKASETERKRLEEANRSSSRGSKTSDTNENYLDNLLRETKLKAQLVGVSEQEAAKLKLLNTLEAKGIDLNDDRVKTLIEEQKNLAELEKAYEAQQEMVGMFKDTLTDALMSVIDGSRSVADAFKNMMRQIFSSLAQKSIIQPLVSGLTGGLAGGAVGGLAAGAGIAATMGTIGSSLGAGFMTSVYGGLAGTAGAVSGGLSVGGAAGIATAIGAVAAPLLAVAAVFSFFKKKVKELDSGISATVTNMDSYVESFSTIQTKRFWGLSKKVSTNTTAMGADNPISAAIASVQQSIFSTAQYLGIATDSLSAFSYEFKLSLKGLSEEAKMQKIAEEVDKLGDAFANLLPNVLNMEHLTAIMDERYSLETRLLEAQGNTQALRERELANTNEYNRAILEQIFAAEDAKAALDNLNNSLKETDFATLLDFNRAKAYARLGMNVANSPEVPSMSNAATSGLQAITNPMNTASGEIVQLRSEMKEMHKEAMFAYSKLIKNGKDSRDTLRSWDVVGLPAERTA